MFIHTTRGLLIGIDDITCLITHHNISRASIRSPDIITIICELAGVVVRVASAFQDGGEFCPVHVREPATGQVSISDGGEFKELFAFEF